MTRFNRPCLDCGKLSRGSRCPEHQAIVDKAREARISPARRAKKKALYGGDYRARRRAVLANATNCYLCGGPATLENPLEADHIIPGDPSSPLLPAHRRCNRSKGDKPITDLTPHPA